MSDSITLELDELNLDQQRIIERDWLYHKTLYFTISTNSLDTLETITNYTPGWYYTQLSYSPANSTNGQARLYRVTTGDYPLIALTSYANSAPYGINKDADLLYLNGEDLRVQAARYDDGGVAALGNIVFFAWLLHV